MWTFVCEFLCIHNFKAHIKYECYTASQIFTTLRSVMVKAISQSKFQGPLQTIENVIRCRRKYCYH